MYLEILIVLLVYFTGVFIIGQIIEDNSIVDIAWGGGFVVVALWSFFSGGMMMPKSLILTVLVTLWGLRLLNHLGRRNIGKGEDYRYVAMRQRWGNQFPRLKAYVYVYLLQMTVMLVVSLPVVYGNSDQDQSFGVTNMVGVGLWVIGFLFETVGDAQLRAFKAKPENKGKLMDQGLWSLTRHPNYFGDATLWLGYFFIAVSSIQGIWTIIGPMLMAFFLRNVSGAKLLEKKYEGRADYEAYKKRTNMFLPGLPKKPQ